MEDLKSYKDLDAYNYFVSGWLRDGRAVVLNNHVVVTSKVNLAGGIIDISSACIV